MLNLEIHVAICWRDQRIQIFINALHSKPRKFSSVFSCSHNCQSSSFL